MDFLEQYRLSLECEKSVRNDAFFRLSYRIGGIRIRPLEVRDLIALGNHSPYFFRKGKPDKRDLLFLLLHLSRVPKFLRKHFAAHLALRRDELWFSEANADFLEYIAEQFQDIYLGGDSDDSREW